MAAHVKEGQCSLKTTEWVLPRMSDQIKCQMLVELI